MTKIIDGKKLLLISTMIVLVTGLTMAAALDDAEAKKVKTGEHKLKCKSIGSWFNPGTTGGEVFSSSNAKCSAGLGKVTSSAVTAIVGSPSPGCLTLTTADPVGKPDYSMGKKGFIEYTSTGVQCFNNVAGVPLDGIAWTWDGSFCGASGTPSTSAYTSEVIGTYAIVDGIVKGVSVIGGSGTFVSEADHCDPNASNGNSFTSKLKGTIIFP